MLLVKQCYLKFYNLTMIKEFEIENYKSIKNTSIELGIFNIFIGENGCGKSNILEAFAMFSSSISRPTISIDEFYNKGIRVSNPKLTFNSFKNQKNKDEIIFRSKLNDDSKISLKLKVKDIDNIYSEWINEDYLKLIQYLLREKDFTRKNELESSLNSNYDSTYNDYLIYNIETKILRGIIKESLKQPLGVNGEGLDILISNFSKEEFNKLKEHSKFISWLENIIFDEKDILKLDGHKIGKSTSRLYFQDKFMSKKNNIFSAENANEGILHILFYLSLFISKKTPKFFAIDNIEKSLNPKLCRALIKEIAILSKDNDKQALITTHNPAILDGLNLNDDEQRLFVVSRSDEGYTKVERIKLKPNYDENKYKLSEMWMRGLLGGIPNNF